jgi:hypothetical protein
MDPQIHSSVCPPVWSLIKHRDSFFFFLPSPKPYSEEERISYVYSITVLSSVHLLQSI